MDATSSHHLAVVMWWTNEGCDGMVNLWLWCGGFVKVWWLV